MDFQNLDSWGYGGQVGLTFKPSDTLTLGASYQLETRLGELEGDAGMQLGSDLLHTSIPGEARIEDFQWPATLKLGVACTHTFKNTEINSSPLVGLSNSLSHDSLNLSNSYRF